MDKQFGLSKSKYCKGVQCPKILWMDTHMSEKAKPGDDSVLETGTRVGDLARGYFGEYTLVEFNLDKGIMVSDTKRLIDEGKGDRTIAEASFYWDGLFCSVDLLRVHGEECSIVEVKSSTEVKDIYVDDLAFQYYVLSKCGMKIKSASLMHIDSSYERHGELELDKLFVVKDYTDAAKDKMQEVEENVRQIRLFQENTEEPEKDIALCCEVPYECAYYDYCHRQIPERSVFDIKGLFTSKKYEYYHQGIISFEDVIRCKPKLSDKQLQQVETDYFDRPDVIIPEKIREFLNTLRYPLYHLDFETFQQAIPEYDGLHPYEQIPFQYSLHIEHEDGKLEHKEFLAKEGTDPRRAIAESLCSDFPKDACVLAYNMSFERRVLKSLAKIFPDFADHLLAIRDNICDLMVPFQNQDYYTKAMQGSYSIKYVLPALYPDDPELDYHSLEEIHHGGEASSAFADLVNRTPEQIEITRRNLLKYCGLDTYAMVKVLAKLREVCK
ncbi:MAG: DUF2779 domain-containing protein [Lachnospiraceae bacterium]|nr:DUF2779 domain-containing protein [Lachnospiraceae bacterium]